MSRIRTIKPELWDDELLGTCSIPARLLFIGLISNADDEGRLRGAPSRLAGRIFQYDELNPRKVDGWLAELEDAGRIVRYQHGRERFIWLPGFVKNQVINKKTDSKLPPPPPERVDPETGEVREPDGSPTANGRPLSAVPTSPLLPGREGKGRERNGVEGTG